MKHTILFLCLALLLTSCHHKHVVTCTTDDPILLQYSPDDIQYKAELIKQLNMHDRKKLHFYIEKYVERAKKPFMFVSIEGDGLCARMVLDIKNENKLADYKTVKGLTYNGAEITAMQFGIDSSFGSYLFLFEEGVIVK
ncbi:MAG: hypothetical protein JWQ38_3103 [Flavipsychrobacter sp.]|nr:hypothetical protein [Flavipsychrobacter sp.]